MSGIFFCHQDLWSFTPNNITTGNTSTLKALKILKKNTVKSDKKSHYSQSHLYIKNTLLIKLNLSDLCHGSQFCGFLKCYYDEIRMFSFATVLNY